MAIETSRPPPNSTIPQLFLQLLFDYFEENQLDHKKHISLDRPAKGADPLEGIDAKAFCDALISIAAALDKPFLGIEMGARIRLEHLGTLGDAFSSCGTVAEAMLRLISYKDLLHATHDMEIRPEGEHFIFEWPVNSWYFGRIFDELGLTAMIQIMRDLSGRREIIAQVEFINPEPESREPYHRYFGENILFNRPATKIYVLGNILSSSIASRNQTRTAQLDEQIQAWIAGSKYQSGIEGDTRKAIVQLTREGMPSLEQVAIRLEISARKLARELGSLDLNYRTLREESLKSLAEAYMKQPELSLTDIAHLLGYSEQSVLSRAARRWTGLSTREWRKQLTQPSND